MDESSDRKDQVSSSQITPSNFGWKLRSKMQDMIVTYSLLV